MRYRQIYLTLFFAFLLGSHKGFIALWTGAGPEPDHIFPYSVSSLPIQDQRRLESGILLESEEALIRLLEDYLS